MGCCVAGEQWFVEVRYLMMEALALRCSALGEGDLTRQMGSVTTRAAAIEYLGHASSIDSALILEADVEINLLDATFGASGRLAPNDSSGINGATDPE